ncbi:MAG: MaoC family dehydratase [bacterium]|nr:MaoC family dehydratase [bacterium]
MESSFHKEKTPKDGAGTPLWERVREEDLPLVEELVRRQEEYRNNKTAQESIPYDALEVGQEANELVEVTEGLITFFGITSGDTNRAHMDNEYAKGTKFGGMILHGVYTNNIISKLLGTKLPGLGTVWLESGLKFLKPVKPGETLVVYVKVKEKQEKGRVLFEVGANVNGESVAEGKALVIAPREKVVVKS